MSNRTKFTKERWGTVVGTIRDGYTLTDACQMAGIGRSTVYKWLKIYPDLNKAIVEATDLQWKYTSYQMRRNYRGYKRNLVRPSKYYQSPNNVPFKIPPIESKDDNKVLEENKWWLESMRNAY